MATLVAKSARKSSVFSSSGAGVTSTEKSAGTLNSCLMISNKVSRSCSIIF